MARDHFEVLGLPRAYHLDAGDLERRYLALQKETHPDRFARAMPRERMEAMVRNTELNDAYKVLKNDIRRAEYILKLEGVDIGEEKPQSTTGATKQLVVDPMLLMEIMELREALAEARSDGNDGKVAELTRDVVARRAAALRAVDEGYSAYETGSKAALDGIARALVSLRYYGRFMDEVEDEE
ncbi:MAG TPA: Fe-S protein assembly co-chaperone HscB [Polyangia bacterium]